MKLLIFIHSLSAGGAERVTVNLANYWANMGWALTIVTMTGREQDFYELHPDIRRIALRVDANSTNAIAAVRHNLRRVRALRAVLKEEEPDVALGMMTTAICLLSIAATGSGIPVIGSERSYPPLLPLHWFWSVMQRLTYPRAWCVVAQTGTVKVWLEKYCPGSRVKVIPNPVVWPLPPDKPILEPKAWVAPDRKALLAVGRLGPEKGFNLLLDAFADVVKKFPDWDLVILGEGPEREALGAKRVVLGLEGRVFMPGRAGNVGVWYDRAELYVMTSRYEGFPNTLLEALAHGLPAVIVDCETGPRDILRHEVDGLLVPQDDNKALVEALVKLMRDENLRENYATRAVEARDRFALERITEMWERLFAEVKEKNEF